MDYCFKCGRWRELDQISAMCRSCLDELGFIFDRRPVHDVRG